MPKLTSSRDLKKFAETFSNALLDSDYEDGEVDGWAIEWPEDFSIRNDSEVLEAFTVAARQLQSDDFGQDILQEWRDERETLKAEDPSSTTADFIDEYMNGYLGDFTGRNLTQLMKFYLSPKGIESGAWDLQQTAKSNDGVYVAYVFCPPSFREYDGFIWVQEVATGKGYALSHDLT